LLQATQEDGGCSAQRGELVLLVWSVSIIIIIIIIFVNLIIFGEFASQTKGLLLSLPKLCTGLEEALFLRTGAAQGP
jgi:hypothetical protein